MRFTVILAARTGSRRLPGKMLLPFGGRPMIAYLIERLRPSRLTADIVLATTDKPEDDILAETVRALGVRVYRGAEDDVVARYAGACAAFGVDHAVRVTGDCPFVDAATLDHCLKLCQRSAPFDLATTKGLFPQGIDYEVVPASVLVQLDQSDQLSASHREHLTLYLYENAQRFAIAPLPPPAGLDRRDVSFTVDTAEDYAWCSGLAQPAPGPSLPELLEAAARSPRPHDALRSRG